MFPWERMKFWCCFVSDFPGVELKNFVFLSRKEALMVLSWRNHPKIATHMIRSSQISCEEHLSFLKNLFGSHNKAYYLVFNMTVPIGVIYLNPINWALKEAELGLYQAPDQKGYGILLMELLEYVAFNLLKLKRLIARAKSSNSKAIKLYEKFSYVPKDQEQNLLVMVKEMKSWENPLFSKNVGFIPLLVGGG